MTDTPQNDETAAVDGWTVGSLFSGIGGLELGLERAGMRVLWHSEIDPYACSVLAKNWPHVPNLGDITTIEWSAVPRVRLLCGGYPCPAFSQAARGRNVAPDLWPHMRDAIAALRPEHVLIENVAAHLGRGFSDVLFDLDALGFDAEWATLTACSVGAPHTRRRVFAHAHAHGHGQPVLTVDEEVAGLRPLASPRRDGWLPTADDVGTDDGVPHRVDRDRVLGNAVVPYLAEVIGRRLVTCGQAFEWPPLHARNAEPGSE